MRKSVAGQAWVKLVLLAVMAIALPGCMLKQIKEQTERISDAGQLEGTITVKQVPMKDVVVAVLRKKDATQLTLYRVVAPDSRGHFGLAVPPGEFYVGAYVDRNGDDHYQPGEPGVYFGKPTFIQVAAKETVTIALTLTATSKPEGLELPANAPQQPEVGGNVGVVTTIDDALFDPDNGVMGMWRPFDFMLGPRGGVFMLGEYDPGRIPVLFVHGIAGTPRDFKAALAGLDLTRYQPWVLYYPSGVRLEMVGNGLTSAMHQLQRRFGYKQYAIVAHSMGGLVARAYIQRYAERYPEDAKALKMFLTVNSPQGGMGSAALAVDKSPIVVPAWQDVAEGSDFIKQMEQYPWPADLPYYLVFSFDGDENGDGTVPLNSQLPRVFQAQARRMYGFQGTHVGTLSNPEFISLMNQLLDSSTAAAGARKAAN